MTTLDMARVGKQITLKESVKRAKLLGVRKNPAVVAEAEPSIPRVVRINATNLTEDDADYLFYLKHKDDKRYSLDEVKRQARHGLER